MTVLVVGAGPVGLTLALSLARFGHRSTVIEMRTSEPHVGSRSICIQRATLEAFERIGVGAQIADEGVAWSLGRTFFRDRELFQTRFPATTGERFPPFVNLGQQRVEEILLTRVTGEPLVDLLWEHELQDVEQDADAVVASASRADGQAVRLRARYLAACDGGRSRVRERLGIGFDGHSHADQFLIADIRADVPFPNERRFYFDPPFNRGRQVLIHPQPDGVWRIDWQVPPGVDLEAERSSGALGERIRSVIGPRDYELVWLSIYVFHQRLAERLRDGRVFLAGDAAHVFAPFGARGMNSGIQDAENLAWRLALADDSADASALLDAYASERRAAAAHNLAVTDATMRFMVPPSRRRLLARDAILRASTRSHRARARVDSGRLSEPHVYGAPGTPAPIGAVAPDGALDDLRPGSDARRLRDLVTTRYLALCVGSDAAGARSLARAATAAAGVPLAAVALLPRDAEPGPDVVVDRDDVLRSEYGARAGDVVLIRPDGHVQAHVRAGLDRLEPALRS